VRRARADAARSQSRKRRCGGSSTAHSLPATINVSRADVVREIGTSHRISRPNFVRTRTPGPNETTCSAYARGIRRAARANTSYGPVRSCKVTRGGATMITRLGSFPSRFFMPTA
jgi:hypothetical protein